MGEIIRYITIGQKRGGEAIRSTACDSRPPKDAGI